MESQQPSNPRYQIGFIAAPRASERTKGFSRKRGIHQFTGHTAVYIKIDNEEIVRGLSPDVRKHKNIFRTIKGIIRIINALLFDKTVKGYWHNDRELLNDKTSKYFTLDVSKEDAEAFKSYFFDRVVNHITDYTLRPHERVAKKYDKDSSLEEVDATTEGV